MKYRRAFAMLLAMLLCLSACTAGADDPWTCAQCGKSMNGGNFCSACGAARSAGWICAKCGNAMKEGNFCANCGQRRPDDGSSATAAGPVLPDPQMFFSALNYNEEPRYLKSDGANYCSFKTTADQKDKLLEYVDCAIGHYQFELAYEYDTSMKDIKYYEWDRFLRYTGNTRLNAISLALEPVYTNANAIVILQQDTKNNYALLSIYYTDGISFSDDGYRCSQEDMKDLGKNARSSRNDSSARSAYTPASASSSQNQGKTRCVECGGKGYRKCQTCGGDGYIDVYVRTPGYGGVGTGSSGWEHKPCSNLFCHSGRVDCFYCNGTGWV